MKNSLLADTITQIRNGYAAKKLFISVPASKLIFNLCSKLKEEGYILNVKISEDKRNVIIDLKYGKNGLPAIKKIRIISTCGCRKYIKMNTKVKSIKKINVFEELFLSTPIGIETLTNLHYMGKNAPGGEVLMGVY